MHLLQRAPREGVERTRSPAKIKYASDLGRALFWPWWPLQARNPTLTPAGLAQQGEGSVGGACCLGEHVPVEVNTEVVIESVLLKHSTQISQQRLVNLTHIRHGETFLVRGDVDGL